MANSTCKNDFMRNPLISDNINVVILEDQCATREAIRKFIEEELGWKAIIAENRDEAVRLCESQQAKFYILDIHLGDKRSHEGLDAAQEIKSIDKSVFVSIFSGVPNLNQFKKIADRVGVNYFEEKGIAIQAGICRIAVEMLGFQNNLVNQLLENYFNSPIELDDEQILKLIKKKKEINLQLSKIKNLEKSYQSDSFLHPIEDLAILDDPNNQDVNIQAYESYKRDLKWFSKHQGKYVVFLEGQWLQEIVSDSNLSLLERLNLSVYAGKSLYYVLVTNEIRVIEIPLSFYDFEFYDFE